MANTFFCKTKEINGHKITNIIAIDAKQVANKILKLQEDNILYTMVKPEQPDENTLIYKYDIPTKSGKVHNVIETFSFIPAQKYIGFKLGSYYFWYQPTSNAFINKDFGTPLFTSRYKEQAVNLAINYPYNYDVFMCNEKKEISEFYNFFENSDILICKFINTNCKCG